MFKSVMKSKHHLVLTIYYVFLSFLIFKFLMFANMVDNPIGKIAVALALCLLSMNTLLGVIGLLPHVLIQRSADTTGTQLKKIIS